MLAIVNACHKYHYFICGHSDVTVETDHKPLGTIFRKEFDKVPSSLQRFWPSLQRYGLKVIYVPDRKIPVADFLSRLDTEERMENLDGSKFVAKVSVSQSRQKEFADETMRDEQLRTLRDFWINGWPNDKKEVPEIVRTFWPYRDEIHVQDDLIFR